MAASTAAAAPLGATSTTGTLASGEPFITATFSAPTNIAVIKYWGKRDVKLNLPINSSVSVTLNQDDLRAMTSVMISPAFEKDRLWLNGEEEDVSKSKRIQTVLAGIRAIATDRTLADGTVVPAAELADPSKWRAHIVSANSFPTAAGLASSAAGYACLTRVLAEVYGAAEPTPNALTAIARQGSGSASRSLYGGFVRWNMGAAADGSDSFAEQVATADHWPDLEVIVCVVSADKKETGSTAGMTTSVETSELLAHRAAAVVEPRLSAIEAAYTARDFPTFGAITMRDSNQFHACCLDTFPPIFYMNDVSKRLIALVHRFNAKHGSIVAAYTFDAGPNAVIYTTKAHTAALLATVMAHFPRPAALASDAEYVSSAPALEAAKAAGVPAGLECPSGDEDVGAVRYIYKTTPGDGPRRLDDSASLVDSATGTPAASAAAGAATAGSAGMAAALA
ncbi:hypothetical protein FNF31_02736 [Cafeteria roenbergensis]|uniref:Diphosphomevalonate decarboxylase n=1 Tax=Cafeteria roenbergensis TaxID=33653 RepID=A0A5A8DJ08_CAFRO|nr:hypothetical protein FNF31_02736 [Cafeteria roenbergensis]KAA0164617.1 hypothetical protein FNF28_03776 [Cafeteria roenbergensis]